MNREKARRWADNTLFGIGAFGVIGLVAVIIGALVWEMVR